ncbi:MAG: hypothetical protein A2653_00815 [Candidatus Zambryskibacteria bacterium RIFCSPHIGHO2_01_FULL_43_25]|uniref:Uncharacterized protein n=1 Tax=Candidatus Zambryskibacteria bacterium RIFCSPLOWO2_01_FULL_45_21 TaxID=1802761 RepID=A0A1G2U4L7_9BACT|nr:MAG: hypothetical protein A2653_00815 [Candidatus Zambryskibacteria bacterium RIFCSPHIGHO2_01_FULL_43_25]OHB00630.1 MAG: hypothetical protein A3E94_03295 [Candidatus Zambryskibacteria bacterium RIFCSPHIGHO2_12_FULL_44_12b]OHB04445.1 MAG: hypothetical protein A3B14_03340 [Candidatus Zambryskibacteria bacterium RIFCSPLOWO2_01_FULL_45_21]
MKKNDFDISEKITNLLQGSTGTITAHSNSERRTHASKDEGRGDSEPAEGKRQKAGAEAGQRRSPLPGGAGTRHHCPRTRQTQAQGGRPNREQSEERTQAAGLAEQSGDRTLQTETAGLLNGRWQRPHGRACAPVGLVFVICLISNRLQR